jgi:hypothetical protein
LREAIRQEEELASALKNGGSSGARKRTRTGSLADGRDASSTGVGGTERIDGRAGPKSENVVLQKSKFTVTALLRAIFIQRCLKAIDHIRAQLDERQRLKLRLERAKGSLPATHSLVADSSNRREDMLMPWERPWYGGKNDEEGGSEED